MSPVHSMLGPHLGLAVNHGWSIAGLDSQRKNQKSLILDDFYDPKLLCYLLMLCVSELRFACCG